MTDTAWARYVRRISGGAGGSEIEKRTGIRQSNVSRWLNDGTTPQPAQAAKFAQAYGGNVLEAFVAAGFLTEAEAGVPPRPEVDLHVLVDEDPELSPRAKAHLKESYELLKDASARASDKPPADVVIRDNETGDPIAVIELKSDAPAKEQRPLPKAARHSQSRGRALRHQQDEDATANQESPTFDVAFGSQVIDVDDPTEQPEPAGAQQRGAGTPD